MSSGKSNEQVSRDAAGWPPLDTLDTAFQSFVGFQRVQTAETTKDERDNHPHDVHCCVIPILIVLFV